MKDDGKNAFGEVLAPGQQSASLPSVSTNQRPAASPENTQKRGCFRSGRVVSVLPLPHPGVAEAPSTRGSEICLPSLLIPHFGSFLPSPRYELWIVYRELWQHFLPYPRPPHPLQLRGLGEMSRLMDTSSRQQGKAQRHEKGRFRVSAAEGREYSPPFPFFRLKHEIPGKPGKGQRQPGFE